MALGKELADKLVKIASKQLTSGTRLKKNRMDTIKEIEDLYNNEVVEMLDNRVNIPFPVMSGQIDKFYSKVDNPPTVSFRVTDLPNFSDKIEAAWKDDRSVMRTRLDQKDRAEKKMALISGRAIAKIYASSRDNQYKAHYDLVDYHSFVCEGRRGHLEDNLYCGETDILRTLSNLESGAEAGIYDKRQVELLKGAAAENDDVLVVAQAGADKFNRAKALGLTPEGNAFVGQQVVSLVEWAMDFEGERYYLLFEPKSNVWLRADKLKDVFSCNKYPWVSWAVNYDEYNFWSKGVGDDILPVAEAMRLILNETIENTRRRNRPMRIIAADQFEDPNELQEYLPDNVILSTPGKDKQIVDIITPEITTSVNLVQFLDSYLGQKTGVGDSATGVTDRDTKVGVFFGTLQQEADRIGTINKEYSDSYAEKGYRYFWGLKDHLTNSKAIELLGKDGIHMDELTKKDLSDVGDVDDVVVSGGSREEEVDEIKSQRQSKVLAELTGNPAFSQKLNPDWVIKTALKTGGFNDDDVQQALDTKGGSDTQLIKEADYAIREILLGKTPRLNRGATTSFMQHILDYDINNIDISKLDRKGNVVGVDEKKVKESQALRAYAQAHMPIVSENMVRKTRDIGSKLLQGEIEGQLQEGASSEEINLPAPTEQENQQSTARPFENGTGTPGAVAQNSQLLSQSLRP